MFTLAEHIRDLNLMTNIKETLKMGKIYKQNFIVALTITKNSEINTLINMFKSKFLCGAVKKLNFEDFCKIQEIINSGLHKTEEGLNNIKIIKQEMN